MKTFADMKIELDGRSGEEVSTTCPQCSHTRKNKKARCLSANTEKGVWFCHHCEWSGSLKSGEESRSRPPARIAKPHFDRPAVVASVVRDWFEKRRIPEAILLQYAITLRTAYLPDKEAEVPCVVFPYFRQGETVNLKYRSLEGKSFRQVKDAEKVLYGLDDLTEDWAVITEGECDKLALATAGIANAVSVPDGAPPAHSKPSGAKFEYLVNCAPQLEPLKKIILAVDSDGPGHTLEEELARRLGPERCFRVHWPEGCKDANDVLIQMGVEELRRCIAVAKPYPLEGILQVTDVVQDVVALYREGLRGGVSTGFRSVDPYYTVRPGELTIVTGIPSHGKSQFLDALVVNLAKEHAWYIAICSPENLPVSRHLAKLVEQHSGQPFREGPTVRITQSDLLRTLDLLHDQFVFIAPDDALTVPDLLMKSKALVTRHGIRGLIIDPWNEFDHTRPAGQTETEYISASLGLIRRFARAHGVHVWVVAHPKMLCRDKKGRYPVPTPYDISGSAHWRNKADNCLTVWRDQNEPDKPVHLYVQKVRFREVGRVGSIQLRWNAMNGRYEDL